MNIQSVIVLAVIGVLFAIGIIRIVRHRKDCGPCCNCALYDSCSKDQKARKKRP